jgi:hypothetical protein
MDDETFKIGYPKSTIEVTRCKSLWSSSREELKRFKRLISILIVGHNTLEMYLTRMEDIVINSLEELSSMSHPVDFLKEMKNISFNIIIEIFMGSYNQHIITKIGNSFTEIYCALFSMPINFPGFAFHKGLLVIISYIYNLHHHIIIICFRHQYSLVRGSVLTSNSFSPLPIAVAGKSSYIILLLLRFNNMFDHLNSFYVLI